MAKKKDSDKTMIKWDGRYPEKEKLRKYRFWIPFTYHYNTRNKHFRGVDLQIVSNRTVLDNICYETILN